MNRRPHETQVNAPRRNHPDDAAVNNGVAEPASETLRTQVPRFVAVGVVATLVHYGTAVFLIRHGDVAPNPANAMGWLAAVGTSFLGHLKLTFRRAGVRVFTAAIRFFALSALLFALNAACYALLLRFGPASAEVALAAVLAGQAIVSFLASRAWAFRRTR